MSLSAGRTDGRWRLLVAEDMRASRLLLQALLQRAGHEVVAVEDGAQALSMLRAASFDAVVLDLHMPGMDGLDAAVAIRRGPGRDARVPLIALSAESPEEAGPRCRAAGFDAVLPKPCDARRLFALIAALRRGADAAIPHRPVGAPG
ncbi:response regulator [Falsiroseomonas oryzae]|uniref:response regulator n=1 Tax=Falsiroseomonas oryzae TaxID=2766473 RepID=UPI0022EB57B7|nr:response regulator [Roseomonas sp. MO-31]